jgi:hypothetical protein
MSWSASPLLEHRQPLQQIQHQRSEHNNAGKRAFFWRREKERSDGVDFLKSTSSSTTTYVLDAHAGNDFRHIMLDCSTCLTRARAQRGGHFVTALRRMMTVQEIGRLQGCPTSVTNALRGSHVTDDGIGAAFGDAMRINVRMRVLPRALYAA